MAKLREPAEKEAYVADLRERHASRRGLIKMLDGL
jgi:hypothetical protein